VQIRDDNIQLITADAGAKLPPKRGQLTGKLCCMRLRLPPFAQIRAQGTTPIVVELKLSATQIGACNLFIAASFDLLNRIRLKSSSTGHRIQYFQYLTNEAVQMVTPPADLCVLFFALPFILYG
jgi:hypothetical protein